MKKIDGKLEILIGRFLDGEISPAEQKVLENELEHNAQARELLEQMQLLTECSREVMASEVVGRGKGPE
jgi:anti-sigma factor RsiW